MSDYFERKMPFKKSIWVIEVMNMWNAAKNSIYKLLKKFSGQTIVYFFNYTVLMFY